MFGLILTRLYELKLFLVHFSNSNDEQLNSEETNDIDSLEPLKCRSQSIDSSEDATGLSLNEPRLLPTVIENDIERSPEFHQNDAQSSLRKVASAARFDLTGVPVTEADPLGALSNSASPTSTFPKSATTTDLQTDNLNTKRPSLQV